MNISGDLKLDANNSKGAVAMKTTNEKAICNSMLATLFGLFTASAPA